jgi:hypothetical protein
LLLFMQVTACAFSLARFRAGSNKAAKMAMMAITTNNSINVKPRRAGRRESAGEDERCVIFFLLSTAAGNYFPAATMRRPCLSSRPFD